MPGFSSQCAGRIVLLYRKKTCPAVRARTLTRGHRTTYPFLKKSICLRISSSQPARHPQQVLKLAPEPRPVPQRLSLRGQQLPARKQRLWICKVTTRSLQGTKRPESSSTLLSLFFISFERVHKNRLVFLLFLSACTILRIDSVLLTGQTRTASPASTTT